MVIMGNLDANIVEIIFPIKHKTIGKYGLITNAYPAINEVTASTI